MDLPILLGGVGGPGRAELLGAGHQGPTEVLQLGQGLIGGGAAEEPIARQRAGNLGQGNTDLGQVIVLESTMH